MTDAGGGRWLQRRARYFLDELEGSRLEVVLIPSRDPDCYMRGGMIRAVQEQNADWYRAFCDRYQSNRRRMRSKSDTKIKRQHTRRALNELIAGECRTYYAERVRDFIYWWVESERQRRQSAA